MTSKYYDPEKNHASYLRYKAKHGDRINEMTRKNQRRYHKEARIASLEILGGVCIQCGINDLRVLEIDHIEGGGTKDRVEGGGTMALYRRIRNGDVLGLQLLCANCHNIKTWYKEESLA